MLAERFEENTISTSFRTNNVQGGLKFSSLLAAFAVRTSRHVRDDGNFLKLKRTLTLPRLANAQLRFEINFKWKNNFSPP